MVSDWGIAVEPYSQTQGGIDQSATVTPKTTLANFVNGTLWLANIISKLCKWKLWLASIFRKTEYNSYAGEQEHIATNVNK